ncbi:uncharacterized protein V1516DRAFT_687850 [Lipomyces oligophaga]|uniref:uncharacterized protein n=1 Tax=Lipomyces oligophaga TaxID=45792 RepID=UPI0034CD6800
MSRPVPNRSPSILVTDSRSPRVPRAITGSRSGQSGPAGVGAGGGPKERSQTGQHISVGELLFEHGTSEIASNQRRGRPSEQFVTASTFSPYDSVGHGRQRPGVGTGTRSGTIYEDVPLVSNMRKERDPRFVVQSSRTGRNFRRRVTGYEDIRDRYTDDPDVDDEYGSLTSDEDEYDEEDDVAVQDEYGIADSMKTVFYLPPSPDVTFDYDRLSIKDKTMGRVSAYCIAEEYNLPQFHLYAVKTHCVRSAIMAGGSSPDAALYITYQLPLRPGRHDSRVRSGWNSDETENQLSSSLSDDDNLNRLCQLMEKRAELVVFGYGVMVFWNFTEAQERDLLADFQFATNNQVVSSSGVSLMKGMRADADRESEHFRYEYGTSTSDTRVVNDNIIIRASHDPTEVVKSKLTVAHGIAQSLKLTTFETKMEKITTNELEKIPRRLALIGTSGKLAREDVLKVEGRIFKLKVDVTLNSSVLDVPDYFWEDEPGMHRLYTTVREYLEIHPRIKILNKRCQVYLDLADILADSINESNMSSKTLNIVFWCRCEILTGLGITWIIIILIVISLGVSTVEILLRFATVSRLPQC